MTTLESDTTPQLVTKNHMNKTRKSQEATRRPKTH